MLVLFLISLSLVSVSLAAPTPPLLAQSDVWRISVARGEVQSAALDLTNNCVATHRFRVAVSSVPPSLAGGGGSGLLTFDPQMEQSPVEAKSVFQAPFQIDARDVEPGTYIKEIRLQCLDCAAEPDCRPTDAANRLEIDVLPVGSQAVPLVRDSKSRGISDSPHPLSNQDILDLAKAGFGEAVILAKIKMSPCDFDTSVAALMELKSAGLSDNVILAVVRAAEGTGVQSEDIPAPSSAENPPKRSVTVPDGTSVEIEVVQTVTSEDLTEGDIVTFRVVQTVKIGDAVVIEAGAPARARVIEVDKARHWGRSGKILWAMQDALAVDASNVPLRFTKEAKGGGSSGKVGIAVVATAIVFWPAAPVWGLKKGKKAVVPAGQRYQVFVQGDAEVTVPSP